MDPNTRFIISWTSRMSKKHGSVVWEGHRWWDWGQAICRERYGPEWIMVLKDEDITDPDTEAVEIAKRWEGGYRPEWVTRYDIE